MQSVNFILQLWFTLTHCVLNFFFFLGQDDDGFILYESKAICYYIASKYADQGTQLLPTGLKANVLYQQAVFAQVSHFDEHTLAIVKEIVYKR